MKDINAPHLFYGRELSFTLIFYFVMMIVMTPILMMGLIVLVQGLFAVSGWGLLIVSCIFGICGFVFVWTNITCILRYLMKRPQLTVTREMACLLPLMERRKRRFDLRNIETCRAEATSDYLTKSGKRYPVPDVRFGVNSYALSFTYAGGKREETKILLLGLASTQVQANAIAAEIAEFLGVSCGRTENEKKLREIETEMSKKVSRFQKWHMLWTFGLIVFGALLLSVFL